MVSTVSDQSKKIQRRANQEFGSASRVETILTLIVIERLHKISSQKKIKCKLVESNLELPTTSSKAKTYKL